MIRPLLAALSLVAGGCDEVTSIGCPTNTFETALYATNYESCWIAPCTMEQAKISKEDAVNLRRFANSLEDRCQRAGYRSLADYLERYANATLAGDKPWLGSSAGARAAAKDWPKPKQEMPQ